MNIRSSLSPLASFRGEIKKQVAFPNSVGLYFASNPENKETSLNSQKQNGDSAAFSKPLSTNLLSTNLKNQWESKKQKAAHNRVITSPLYECMALLGLLVSVPTGVGAIALYQDVQSKESSYRQALERVPSSSNKSLDAQMAETQTRVQAHKEEYLSARRVSNGLNSVFALEVLGTLTGAAGFLYRAFGKRGKLYVENTALPTAEVQNNIHTQLNHKALKRMEYIEKYPDLRDFLSTLYGQPSEPSQSVHTTQLKGMFEALMFFKLVPGKHNHIYNPSHSYYEEIYKRVLSVNKAIDYFPELELMEKVVIPEMHLDTQALHQAFKSITFRPLLNSIHNTDMTAEDKIPQLKQAFTQIESPLLFLKTQWIKEILETIPLEEDLAKAQMAIKKHEDHLNQQEIAFQQLEKTFLDIDAKIEKKQQQLKSAMTASDESRSEAPALESQLNDLLNEKIRWNQAQMDFVKLQMEKISLNQKSQAALALVNSAKERIQKLRAPLDSLLAEKNQLTEVYQHLMSVAEMKQKMGWENHPSVDTTLLLQLLEKEQQNPVLDSMVKKFEGPTVLREPALKTSIEKDKPS